MTFQDDRNPFLRFKARNLLGWSLLILFGGFIILVQVAKQAQWQLNGPIWTLLLTNIIYLYFLLWVMQRFTSLRVNVKQVVGRLPNHYKWLPTAGLVIAVLLFSLSAFLLSFWLLSFVAPRVVEAILNVNAQSAAARSSNSVLGTVLSGITIVVVAPLVEELIFRGVLLQRWAMKWGIRTSLIVSSVVFGVLHANVLGLTMFGLIMGLLYIKTRTLLVPIACHALNNALALSMGFVPESATAETVNKLDQLRANGWIGLILLALSAPWLVRFISKNWPRQDTPIPYLANASLGRR